MAPETTQRRLQDIFAVADRLSRLLETENAALRRQQGKALQETIEEKSGLARLYESRVRALQETPPAKGEVDEKFLEKLRVAGRRLETLMVENTRLLNAAMTASRTVVNFIADAVREQGTPARTYSPVSQQVRAQRLAAARAPSLTIDQVL